MRQYANYTLRDFVQDENFIHWVKYPDAENTRYWEQVSSENPAQASVIARAASVVKGLANFYPDVPEFEIEKARLAIMEQHAEKQVFWLRRARFYFPAAASVLLLIGIAVWYKPQVASVPFAKAILSGSSTEIEEQNQSTVARVILLPDSSTITLSPKSSVRYEMNGADRREVHLEGEAFFDVRRNEAKPFYVFCSGLTTKVLGTRFKVSAYPEHEEVKVEVTSGKVRVYSTENEDNNPELGGITLTPNQQAVYSKKDLQLTRTVVEQPKVLVTQEQLKTYTYTDTPISKIFAGLEDIYGIKVIYDEEKFRNCRLNMALTDESLFEKLELIGKVVEARYNVIDGQVIFIGDGCSE